MCQWYQNQPVQPDAPLQPAQIPQDTNLPQQYPQQPQYYPQQNPQQHTQEPHPSEYPQKPQDPQPQGSQSPYPPATEVVAPGEQPNNDRPSAQNPIPEGEIEEVQPKGIIKDIKRGLVMGATIKAENEVFNKISKHHKAKKAEKKMKKEAKHSKHAAHS
eukprot:TRINITY_DN302_c0_g1_i1.p1 TRINITY_DN302_c0_g1~~TRINITY_DN302_c0_g1_i1.p1  ORF type:complete len:159 (+),score=43.78 TRINITY_DN302_c0_g1_i1:144-620(+)